MPTKSTHEFPDWYDPEPDEELFVAAHPHPYRYWRNILAGLALIIGAVAVYQKGMLDAYLATGQQLKLVVAGVGVGVLFLFYEYMKYKTTWYLVTSHKVAKYDGIFTNWIASNDPLHLSNVADHELHQGVSQKYLFSAGDIFIYSSGGTNTVDIMFRDIPQAADVEGIIKTLINEHSGSPNPKQHEDADSIE